MGTRFPILVLRCELSCFVVSDLKLLKAIVEFKFSIPVLRNSRSEIESPTWDCSISFSFFMFGNCLSKSDLGLKKGGNCENNFRTFVFQNWFIKF